MTGRSNLAFWFRWVLANVVAEVIGLGAAAAAGVLLLSELGDPGDWGAVVSLAVVMVMFGSFEGVLVGIGQRWAMRSWYDELPWGYWIAATAGGAFVAWTFGLLPSTWMSLGADAAQGTAPEMSDALQLLLAVPLGAVAGAILAYPQFLVLRRYLRRAGRWIVANAAAWALGMPLVFFSAGRVSAGLSPVAAAVRVLGTIAAAGVVVGAVHGWALVRMVGLRLTLGTEVAGTA